MKDTERIAEISRLMDTVNQHLLKLLHRQLRFMGFLTIGPTEAGSPPTESGTPLFYQKWLEGSIAILANNGYAALGTEGQAESDVDLIGAKEPWVTWKEYKQDATDPAWMNAPRLQAVIERAESIIRALPDIWSGEQLAENILSAYSHVEYPEKSCISNLFEDYLNQAQAEKLIEAVKHLQDHEPEQSIRILELGGGTRSSNAATLLTRLPYLPSVQEYCYADRVAPILNQEEEKSKSESAYPYVRYQMFDVEQPVAAQHLDAGMYDIVIASNTLHESRNVRRALRNVKALLRKNGLLLLNEMTESSLLDHVTFGLLADWWKYEEARASGCPFVSVETWGTLLKSEGYHSIDIGERQTFGQYMITAKSDGIVRQKKLNRRPAAASVHERRRSSSSMDRDQSAHPKATPISFQDDNALRTKTESYLKQLVSDVLLVPYDEIDVHRSFDEYGMDSILVIDLTNRLQKGMKEASNTLFFEHPTIGSLAEHLISAHKEAVMSFIGEVDHSNETNHSPSDMLSAPSSSRDMPKKHSERKPTPFARDRIHRVKNAEPDIAIIGLSGRYPAASNVLKFWKNLKHGVNSIIDTPPDRCEFMRFAAVQSSVQSSDVSDAEQYRLGGFLESIHDFDYRFFNLSPGEASRIQAEERLFLQTVWETLEDAGYNRQALNEQTGVFVGATSMNGESGAIANRISHHFNCKGPSMAIDTMCSSSLSAIHVACESIRRGECRMAIAGGVHVFNMRPNVMPDRIGDGDFVPGEGVGAVLLKPLAHAEADGDRIYAVIKSSSLLHEGRMAGYAAGENTDQAELIANTLQKANIDPSTISYFEMHGTGLSYGDLREIEGMRKIFGKAAEQRSCAIGSVKPNIGHLAAASGIAGLTKVLLQLKYAELVPAMDERTLNMDFHLEGTPFYVPQELTPWRHSSLHTGTQKPKLPLRAGISSFGNGGTHTCIILEEYSAAKCEYSVESEPQLIVLSSTSKDRLQVYAKRLALLLKEDLENTTMVPRLEDIAFTLQMKRKAMDERLALVATSKEELVDKLSRYASGIELQGIYAGNCRDAELEKGLFTSVDGEDFVNKMVTNGQLDKIATLWTQGVPIKWELLQRKYETRFVSLPVYPLKEERLAPSMRALPVCGSRSLHPMLDTVDFKLSMNEGIVFKKTLRSHEPFMKQGKMEGQWVLPQAALLEMALAAAAQIETKRERYKLTNIAWLEPVCMVSMEITLHLQIREQSGRHYFEIYSGHESESNAVHASGYYQPIHVPQPEPSFSLEEWISADAAESDRNPIMDRFYLGHDVQYGSYYHYPDMKRLWTKNGCVIGFIECEYGLEHLYQHDFHAGIWECAVQIVRLLLNDGQCHNRQLSSVEEVEKFTSIPPHIYVHAVKSETGKFDIIIANERGQACAILKGLRFVNASDDEGAHSKPITLNPERVRMEHHEHFPASAAEEDKTYGSIIRICRDEPIHVDLLRTHWHAMKNGHSFERLPSYVKDINDLIDQGEDIQHLLIKTNSCKQIEVCLCGNNADETIILFAGFGLTASQWYYQIKDWKSKYRLLVIHPPGVGLSEDNGDLSFAGISNTCSEVLEVLNIRMPVHVMGTSWGGMLAQSFARYFPHKVKTLILISSLCEVRHIAKETLKDVFKQDFERNHKIEEFELIERSEFANPVLQKYIAIHQSNGFDTYHLLPSITAPTLILFGNKDLVADYHQAATLLDRIPNAKLVEINGGHGCNITHHREVNEVVKQYLADQRQLVTT